MYYLQCSFTKYNHIQLYLSMFIQYSNFSFKTRYPVIQTKSVQAKFFAHAQKDSVTADHLASDDHAWDKNSQSSIL